jgi:hypothetical protein
MFQQWQGFQQPYQQQVDPIYSQISTKISVCNYGHYQQTIAQHVYTFLKQYTGFTVENTVIKYSNGTSAYILVLSGGVGMTYQSQKFTIPLKIWLPIGFPMSAPKVYLNYQLDAATAKDNPLIVNGNEIMNNYLHKWNGNTQQYNLGGLCYNLSKSFDIHPPLGASKTEEKVEEVHVSQPATVVQEDPEKAKRVKLVENLKSKVEEKLSLFNGFFEDGKAEYDPEDNYLTRAKEEMEEKSMKMKRQILVLESNKEEMKGMIKQINQFVSKNKNIEVSKDNIDEFVIQKEQDMESILNDVKVKELVLEDIISA